MVKNVIYTAFGILLSFAIAIGGWVLTSRLIGRESARLLDASTAFTVDIPAIELAHHYDSEAPPILDKRAITSILHNWENMGVNRWHEPAPGQITMEQAIVAAREWVSFLQSYQLLPLDMGFTSQMAFLSQNIDPMDSFLPLEYSYWTVNFGSDEVSLHMQINAVTGQVWTTEVTLAQYQIMWTNTLHTNLDEMQAALTAYVALLGMDAGLEDARHYLLQRQDWLVNERGRVALLEDPPWEVVSDEGGAVSFEAAWVLPPTEPTEGRPPTIVLEPPPLIMLPAELRRRKTIAFPFEDGELAAVISVFGIPDIEGGMHFDMMSIGLSVGMVD